ncbi:MAG: RraA family protein [Alphaproteobacteria bacterium]|jgi:regulator of RNase E activity RraA
MTDLSARLERLYTGIVYDTLSEIGLAGQALPPAIQALAPGPVLAGRVWTLSGVRTPSISRDESLLKWTEFLSAAPADHVVICQPNDNNIALMGELSAETLKFRGVKGYIADGGCRDIDFILKLGLPVYCKFATPADIAGRWRVDEMGTTVRIGGIDIATGDYVIADRDGAVIVPEDRVEEVIAKAEVSVASEDKVRAAILDGVDPKDAYLKFGKF